MKDVSLTEQIDILNTVIELQAEANRELTGLLSQHMAADEIERLPITKEVKAARVAAGFLDADR